MEIKKLTLHNIGRFGELVVPLAPLADKKGKVTVFVGNNGAGKTSILKALATALSWLVARIQSESGKGSPIPELVIKNGFTSAAIDLEVHHHGDINAVDEHAVRWRIAKVRKGKKGQHKSDHIGVTDLADFYREKMTVNYNASLPLVAFYSVERVVVDIPLKIRGKHTFYQLDGYDKSLSQGVDFRRFFEWFREREDSENETGLSDELLVQLRDLLGNDQDTWARLSQLNASHKDRQLTAVRSAIHQFMPAFSNLKVKRKPRLHMSIDKAGESLDVAQLSQGEKSLMVLIGDIARRLAVMNLSLENPLQGVGIVLIDEVDMHLHPKWQRSLIDQFTRTFPNCQFVLTTHSPLVISDSQDVLTYLIDENDVKPLPPLYGQDVNTVLLETMDTDVRNSAINELLTSLLDAIHDSQIEEAKAQLAALTAILPADNLELAKARLMLTKKELKVAQNNQKPE